MPIMPMTDNYERAELDAEQRLLALMRGDESAILRRDGYLWCKLNRLNSVYILIPGLTASNKLLWRPTVYYQPNNAYYSACIVGRANEQLPRMDYWLSVYLHAQGESHTTWICLQAPIVDWSFSGDFPFNGEDT